MSCSAAFKFLHFFMLNLVLGRGVLTDVTHTECKELGLTCQGQEGISHREGVLRSEQ